MMIRKNENGFTLVELLIAMTIAALVGTSIFQFMVVGTRSFSSTSSDISIQHESQLVFNQMQDLIVDTAIGIDYLYSDSSVTDVIVANESEIPATATEKKLIMYNYDPADASKHVYEMVWNVAEERVYYSEYLPSVSEETQADGTVIERVDKGVAVHTLQLMGENIVDFTVDLSQMISKRVVRVDLEFEKGTKNYRSSHNITLRNQIVRGGVIPEYLEIVNPVDPEKVDGLAVIYAEPGDVIDMKATGGYKVLAAGGGDYPDQDIRFFMSNKEAYDQDTSVSTDGLLSVSNGQKNDFYVVVASRTGKGVPLTVLVKMVIVDKVEVSLVNLDPLNPIQPEADKPLNSITISAGESFSLEAVVTGREFDKRSTVNMYEVTWSCDEKYKDFVEFTQIENIPTGGKCEIKLDTALNLKKGERIAVYATSKRSVDKQYRENVYAIFYIYQPAGDFRISTRGGLIRGNRDFTNLYADLSDEVLKGLGITDTSKYVLYVDVDVNELVYEVDENNHPSRKYTRYNNVTNTGSKIQAEGIHLTVEAPHIGNGNGNPNAEYEYSITYYIAPKRANDNGSNWQSLQIVGEDGTTSRGYSIDNYLFRSNTVVMLCERAFLHYESCEYELDKNGNVDNTQWDGPLTTTIVPRLESQTIDVTFYGSDSIADSPTHSRITNIMNDQKFKMYHGDNGWNKYNDDNQITTRSKYRNLTEYLSIGSNNRRLTVSDVERKWSDSFPSHIRLLPVTSNRIHTNDSNKTTTVWFDNYVDVYLWNIQLPKSVTGRTYENLYFPVALDGEYFETRITGKDVWKNWVDPWHDSKRDVSYNLFENKDGEGNSVYCLTLRYNGDAKKEMKYESRENDRMWTKVK